MTANTADGYNFAYLDEHTKRMIRRAILKAIWGPHAVDQPEHLRVLVGSLRKKLELDAARPQYVVTEPWVGYRFTAAESDRPAPGSAPAR